MSVADVLGVAGGVVLVGFVGQYLFLRTKIPDVLLLIGIGILLGPVFHAVPRDILYPIAPYVGTFALVLVLFEGGLDLESSQVIRVLGPSMLLMVLAMGGSIALAGFALRHLFGMSTPVAIILGAAFGPPSAAIVLPVAAGLRVSTNARALLSLEAPLSDAFAVIVTLSLIPLAVSGGRLSPHTWAVELAKAFAVGALIAILAAALWYRVHDLTRGRPLAYMVALAWVLILFAAVEYVRGSGAVAVLLFGVLVANGARIARRLGSKVQDYVRRAYAHGHIEVDELLKRVHAEFTFFVRTFFFVTLGLVFVPSAEFRFYLMAATSVAAIALARGGAVWLLRLVRPTACPRSDAAVVWAMQPRGLVSVVLATLPLSVGLADGSHFVDVTFIVVIATNVVMTTAVAVAQRTQRPRDPGEVLPEV